MSSPDPRHRFAVDLKRGVSWTMGALVKLLVTAVAALVLACWASDRVAWD